MAWFEQFLSNLEKPIRFGEQIFAFSWMTLIIEWFVPLLAAFLVFFLLTAFIFTRINASAMPPDRKKRVSAWVRICFRLLYVLLFISLTLRFMEDSITLFFEDFFAFLSTPFYKSGATQISVMTLILTIPIVFLANISGKAARMALESSRFFAHNLSEARRFTVSNLVRYGLMLLVLLIGLSIIGIDLSALIILLGIFGVGIGFGLQHVLANFFAGLVIVINRPYREGDYIQVVSNGQVKEGMVKSIKMINTLLFTADSESIIIPNAQLLNNSVHNLTYVEKSTYLSVPLKLSQAISLEDAKELLIKLALACPFYSGDQEPELQILELGASSIKVQLFIHIASASDRKNAQNWVLERILQEQKAKHLVLSD